MTNKLEEAYNNYLRELEKAVVDDNVDFKELFNQIYTIKQVIEKAELIRGKEKLND